MTEPTTEEKIELLVRSVLEAVDARLDAVRHEIAAFSSDVEQRHHHLLESLAALDARITELASRPTGATDDHALAHLSGELERLTMRVDSLVLRETAAMPLAPPPPAEHLEDLSLPVPSAAVTTGSHPITREELDEISRPFVTRITTQVPIVPDPTGHHEPTEHMPITVPPAVAPRFGGSAPEPALDSTVAEAPDTGAEAVGDAEQPSDAIDLDQLTSLLTERLGSLTLPTRQD